MSLPVIFSQRAGLRGTYINIWQQCDMKKPNIYLTRCDAIIRSLGGLCAVFSNDWDEGIRRYMITITIEETLCGIRKEKTEV
jgi:hypothetical protein